MGRTGWSALLAGLVAAGACTSDGADPTPPGAEDGTPPTQVTLADRDRPVVVPVDGGTLVWGGVLPWDEPGGPALGEYADIYFDDGAVVDGEGAVGVALPPAPFAVGVKDAAGVRVGDLVVVAGIACAEAADTDGADFACRPEPHLVAAAYDLDARRWTELTPPPELADATVAYSWVVGGSGTEAVIGLSERLGLGWWAVDPATDEWRRVPPGPEPRGACVAGDRVVAGDGGRRLAVLDLDHLDGGYVRSAAAPVPWDPPGWAELTCATDRAVVAVSPEAGGSLRANVLDVGTGEWRAASPSPPLPYRMSLGGTAWTGNEVLVLDSNPTGAALGYRPAADAWRLLTPVGFEVRDAVWGDGALVAWDRDGLRRWVPAAAG